MGEPTALLGGMEFGGTASGDVSSGDAPGVCWDDMDFEDIQIDILSLPTDIDATSPLATNLWGGIDLKDIQICVPSPLTDIQVTSLPATDPWGGIDLEDIRFHVPSPLVDIGVMSPDVWRSIDLKDIHVSSPPMDIRVTSPINHALGDMHMGIIQVDNLSPPPAALDMDLEDIQLDVYLADVAESCVNNLEMDLDEVSLTVHVLDYSIQNIHPPRYLSSNFPAPILKPSGLQHRWIWMKEPRGMFLDLYASAPSVLANHP